MDDSTARLKHADLLYDYIKFHLGLYVATPAAMALMAGALGAADTPSFKRGLVGLLVLYFCAGLHASWTVASRVNAKWMSAATWLDFGEMAHSWKRRLIHHYLYWLGLFVGLLGMAGVWA